MSCCSLEHKKIVGFKILDKSFLFVLAPVGGPGVIVIIFSTCLPLTLFHFGLCLEEQKYSQNLPKSLSHLNCILWVIWRITRWLFLEIKSEIQILRRGWPVLKLLWVRPCYFYNKIVPCPRQECKNKYSMCWSLYHLFLHYINKI